MTMLDFADPFRAGLLILILVLGLAMILTVLRLILGPTVTDRTISFDQLSVQAVGLILLIALLLRNSAIVDIAIVTAVLGFLGTFLLAQYLEQRET